MAVRFDYSAVLQNAYLLSVSSSSGSYTSAASTASGVFFEKFRSVFNPGHQNNSSGFEYYFSPMFNAVGSSYKWEVRARGSTTWVKITTGISAGNITRRNGTYDATVALPMQVKLSVKAAIATSGIVVITNYTTHLCAIRAWGPVAT